jgi:spore maturation protein CgeB
MRIVIFCHSLLSDWNHGNAHFLRGIAAELQARGHDVDAYEPRDAWSVQGLRSEGGAAALDEAAAKLGAIQPVRYELDAFDADAAVADADIVIVHEWNEPALVRRVGEARRRSGRFRLFFHDTHHRAATAPEQMARYDLRDYDGVLAFGSVIRDLYLERGWTQRAWTWHEAADVRRFHPVPRERRDGDMIWIGNWGDDERTIELMRYLVLPAIRLELVVRVHGVRYPAAAQALLAESGIAYGGWLSNLDVPDAFSRFDMTLHVPRQPYVRQLPGIPTIRVFEALACGIPLVCAPWDDAEGLFSPGEDFLIAADGREMQAHLAALKHDVDAARALARRGLQTIHARHTCAHRVDELLSIHASLGARAEQSVPA